MCSLDALVSDSNAGYPPFNGGCWGTRNYSQLLSTRATSTSRAVAGKCSYTEMRPKDAVPFPAPLSKLRQFRSEKAVRNGTSSVPHVIDTPALPAYIRRDHRTVKEQ